MAGVEHRRGAAGADLRPPGAGQPGAGGPYAYTRDGFGSFAGYLCAWTYWKAAWIGNAAIAVTLVGYLRVFIPALADPLLMVCVAIAAIWLCTLINLRGIGTFSVVQNLLTILKLLPLLLVGILGWFRFNPEHLAIPARSELPNMGYAQAIATTAALTLWSFIGLESATVPADDVEDPRRTIPRATLFRHAGRGGPLHPLYHCGAGPDAAEVLARSTSPFADAARILMGDWGYYLVAAGAVIACLGALNGWVLLQGQIPVAPARDGLFPESLGQLRQERRAGPRPAGLGAAGDGAGDGRRAWRPGRCVQRDHPARHHDRGGPLRVLHRRAVATAGGATGRVLAAFTPAIAGDRLAGLRLLAMGAVGHRPARRSSGASWC
ncbi:amino acid permease [Pseudomonas aeruginosa]|nr:amino acid permease [Pseudomonas aeruginosa]